MFYILLVLSLALTEGVKYGVYTQSQELEPFLVTLDPKAGSGDECQVVRSA